MAIIATWGGRGLSDGTAVTTSTAGVGDDPFDGVTPDTFTVVDGGLHGPRIQIGQQAATDAQLTWSATITAALSEYALRAYVELSGYPPSGAWRILDPRDSSNVLLWWLDVHNSGTLRLKDPGGITVDETADPVPLGTELRIAAVVQPDGGGGAQVTVRVYDGDDTTPLDTLTATGLGVDFQQIRYGEPGASPTLPRAYIDAMAVSDEAVEIGPVPPPLAPVPRFPLDDRYELDLDGWTDITPWVYERNPVDISRGRSAEADTADPCKMSLTLDNRDGRFSARNPTGPWFGLIGRNTPIRASLPYGSTYMQVPPTGTGQATCPDSAALDITGDLDIRIDVDADQWQDGDLAAKYETVGDQRSWWFGVTAGGVPQLIWSPDGTFASRLSGTSTAPLPAQRGRLALRATLDVDNGAGGHTVRFYTAPTIDGPWIQLGADVTGTGTTSVHAGTAPIEIGSVPAVAAAPLPGRYLGMQLFDGIDGTAVAAPDFTAQTPGDTSFVDAEGVTWTLQDTAELDDRLYRFHGEVPSWPATYALDGVDDYVRITATGISRRLSQNPPTLRSPMTREFSNPARQNIVAYWPMEDDGESTQVASGLADGSPMQIAGAPELGDYDGWTASNPVPTMMTGTLTGTVPPYAGTGQISTRLFVFMPGGAIAAQTSLLRMTATGAVAVWDVQISAAGGLGVFAYDRAGTAITGGTGVNDLGIIYGFNMDTRGFTIVDLEVSNDGAGGVDWRLVVLDFTNTDTIDDPIPTTQILGNIAGYNTGAATSVTVGSGGGLGEVKVGHLAVANDLTAYAATNAAIAAHNGETAVDRMARLCAEEEIEFASYSRGQTGDDVALGDQLDKTLLDLLREAERSDFGVLFEPRDFLGFAYRTRPSLYNQTAAVTLDWDSGQIAGDLVPVDDDQNIRNDITASRVAGSSVRVEQTTGPVSVQAPPDGVGRYDAKVDLSLEDDVQLADQAAWRLHLGTVDEARYPTLTVDLRAPGLTDTDIEDILALDVGDLITLTGLPTPDDVGLLVVGYAETLRLMEHTIVFNCVPASPWEIGVVEESGHDRIDTGGSELAAAVGDGSALFPATDVYPATDLYPDADLVASTTLLVATTAGPSWTLRGDAMPMDIMVAGERATVATVGEVLNDNPYFEADVAGWTPSNATLAHSTTVVHPDGTGSMEITPSGAAAAGGAWAGLIPVAPAATYEAMAWLYAAAGYDSLQVLVNWHTADGTFISSSSGPVTAVPAGEWTHLQASVTAPAAATQAALWVWQTSNPAASDVVHAWAVKLVDAVAVADHFDRTVAGGWGSSPDGRAWTTYGTASDFSVGSGLANMAIASPGIAYVAGLALDSPGADFEVTFDAPVDPITGDPLYTYLLGAFDQAAFSWYALRIAMWGDDTVRVLLEKRDTSGVTSALTGERIVPNVVVDTATTYHARLRVVGGAITAKVWRSAIDEPAGWHIAAHDTSLSGRDIGVQAWVPPGNTNGAVTFQFGEVWVHTPQQFEVTRSVNGVVKAQAAGAPVSIADPVYVAL